MEDDIARQHDETQTPQSEDGTYVLTEVADDDAESNEEWKRLRPEVYKKLALERMREAYIHRDEQRLETALNEVRAKYTKTRYKKEIENAELALEILKAARSLKKACDLKDVEEIKRCIREIKIKDLTDDLINEVREARYIIEEVTHRQRARRPFSMELSRKTMSEIRRYQNPPVDLHRVMQGVLLLLGDDEQTTSNWKEVQRLCTPFDQSGVYRRMVDFEADNVHGELAARSKEILSKYEIEKLRQTSPAGAMLYVWAMSVIDELDKTEMLSPASPTRQRELLGRTAPPLERMDRNYYRTLVRTMMSKTRPNNRPMLPPLERNDWSNDMQYQRNDQDRQRKIPGLYTDYRAQLQPSSQRSALSDY